MTTSPSSSPAQAKSSGSKAQSTAATLTPLQQALKKQQQAADQAAQQSLKQHEARLSEAAEAALTTFKNDIKSRQKWLWAYLIGFPVLGLILCTALAVGGVWTYWKMASPWEVREAPNGVKFRVLKGDWTPCNPKDKNSPLCQLEP